MEVEDYFEEEEGYINSDDRNLPLRLRECNRYHYTDTKTVIEILKSKCLWLTHFSKKNDSSEGRLILEMLGDELKNRQDHIRTLTSNLYLFSLSLFGNQLSQWRGYGDANIGFDYEGLKSDMRMIEDLSGSVMDTSGISFSECKYLSPNDESFKAIVEDIKNRLTEMERCDIAARQYQYLSIGATCFSVKHPGFREEAEYRIFSYLWDRRPFDKNEELYIKFHFAPKRVRRIVVGPSMKQKENMKKIEDFLSSNEEYKHIKIDRSTIPFIERLAFCAPREPEKE